MSRDKASRDALLTEVHQLCELLADMIAAKGMPRPTPGPRWRADFDALLRSGGGKITWYEVAEDLRWSQEDVFWRVRVNNPGAFRHNFATIHLRRREAQVEAEFEKRARSA